MGNKDYRTLFLEKSLLGRKTNFDNTDEVILNCIKRAYRDMLTAGRFYLVNDTENNVENNIDTRCNKFKSILEKANYIYSRNLIKETFIIFTDKDKIVKNSDNRWATDYGLSQKLVNMTYKYFYVFKDYIKIDIDFSNCDCPLDSVILGEKLKLKGYIWSKLTEKEYEYCQKIITEQLLQEDLNTELKSLGNLAFDFINWVV